MQLAEDRYDHAIRLSLGVSSALAIGGACLLSARLEATFTEHRPAVLTTCILLPFVSLLMQQWNGSFACAIAWRRVSGAIALTATWIRFVIVAGVTRDWENFADAHLKALPALDLVLAAAVLSYLVAAGWAPTVPIERKDESAAM
jgi:hypothetical protein